MFRLLVVSLLLVAGCMEGQKPTPLSRTAPPAGSTTKPSPSLYKRLGGEAAVAKVVDDFVANVMADDQIRAVHKKHFKEGDVAALKRKLVDQVCEAAGGPQHYTGKNMKDAHKGLGITDADFDALVADLVKALDKNKVSAREQDELKALLGPMRTNVVEKPE